MTISGYMMRGAGKVTTLIPQRTIWETFSKAWSGAFNLLFDQKSRDRYLDCIQKGVIRDDVFWRNGTNSAMGPILVLALYQELHNPLLKSSGFDAHEFLEGVKPAIEAFHNTEKCLDNKVFEVLNKFLSDDSGDKSQKPDIQVKEPPTSEDERADETNTAQEEPVLGNEERELLLERTIQEAHFQAFLRDGGEKLKDFQFPTKQVENFLNWDWKDELVSRLELMVSHDYLRSMQADKVSNSLMLKMRGIDFKYQEGSSLVENVALLSARAMVMEPEGDENEDEDDVESVKEDELNVGDQRESSDVDIAAQIEVLYDLQHRVESTAEISPTEIKKGEFTERIIRVGILEAYLKGGPEKVELRWKLSGIREAWELPEMASEFDYRPK
jgi:hypothetical protein